MTVKELGHMAETYHGQWGDYCKPPHAPHMSLKADWLDTGRRVLRQLAKELGLEKGTFDIRKNAGGSAVSGESTLHGEWIYVQLGQSCTGLGFMWRYCTGRKDYTGMSNNWASWKELLDLPKLAKKMKDQMPHEVRERVG